MLHEHFLQKNETIFVIYEICFSPYHFSHVIKIFVQTLSLFLQDSIVTNMSRNHLHSILRNGFINFIFS